jgi:hypothetical protein
MKLDADMTGGSAGRDAALVESRIRAEVAELSASLSALFSALPTPVRRAPDLVRALGVDNPLACRLLRVARAADPAEAVEYLPTVNQVRHAVNQAAELAPGPAADGARTAVERFAGLVDELGCNQRGFESLVSALSPRGVRRVDHQHRRAAFRANAHMWGLSAECVAVVNVLVPGAEPGWFDFHAVQGFVGARIMRPDARVAVKGRLRAPSGENAAADGTAIPGAVLMEAFSTLRDAALHEEEGRAGFRATRIEFKGVRPTHAETLFIRRTVARFAPTGTEEYAATNSLVTWPAAMIHKELIVPAGTTDPATAVLEAYANRDDPKGAYELDPRDRVPLHEEVQVIRNVTAPPPAPELPRLPELFAAVTGAHAGAGVRFDVYRVRIAFPMLHSLVSLRVKHVPVQ